MSAVSSPRGTAAVFAGLLWLHLLLLRPPPGTILLVAGVLIVAVFVQARRVFLNWVWGLLATAIGLAALTVLIAGSRPPVFLGTGAALIGAVALWSPLTPRRGLGVLFCLLVLLATVVLTPYSGLGLFSIILDVVVLFLMAEQVRRPPELAVSVWVSLLRSMRVVVPVALVVTAVFWLFPNLSLPTGPTITGFSGDGVMRPGEIATLAQSRRVALVARFAEEAALPSAKDLYWRGQVLEENKGLSWSFDDQRKRRSQTLLDAPPPDDLPVWRYEQDLTSNVGGVVPVLDHAVFVEARRSGVEVAVFDQGAAVLIAVGRGALKLQVASAQTRLSDGPGSEGAGTTDGVPDSIRENPEIQELVQSVIHPGTGLPETLEALSAYFRRSGFSFSLRPGRVSSLEEFLFGARRGFCGHYAAASANLLRMGRIPARIVTGYRGGIWNPWLQTITVRDSEAHAWVEAWDEQAQIWRRFDATDAVAPEWGARIAGNLNVASWPWYRKGISYALALATMLGDRVEVLILRVQSSEPWEYVQPAILVVLLLIAVIWLIRNRRRGTDLADRILVELERRAAESPRARQAGETPLAWFSRLADLARSEPEERSLRALAQAYETGVYKPESSAAGTQAETREVFSEMRNYSRRVLREWR